MRWLIREELKTNTRKVDPISYVDGEPHPDEQGFFSSSAVCTIMSSTFLHLLNNSPCAIVPSWVNTHDEQS